MAATALRILGLLVVIAIPVILTMRIIPNLFRGLVSPVPQTPESHLAPSLKKSKNDHKISSWYFLEGARAARHTYNIVAGNLHPIVYSKDVVSGLASLLANNPKLVVRFLVGPTIFCDKELRHNAIWELYQSGEFKKQLEIRILDKYPEEHFRVADTHVLYLEERHKPRDERREFVPLPVPSCTNAVLYKREFDRAWKAIKQEKKPRFELL